MALSEALEHLVNEQWDAGNLSHQVTSQLIKLFVVYCDEMPTEVHGLGGRAAAALDRTIMMTLKMKQRPRAKQSRKLLETGKGKGMTFLL